MKFFRASSLEKIGETISTRARAIGASPGVVAGSDLCK